ncbi:cardiolipin synthase [Candidatus Palibaumannia cicadellinicola]|uniref:Cardiolipin synthase A n=1 Tax=Candidatus Palibaumannia cicadellinicola TaxID=186490 RepID=A0A0K2BKJ1_9GAMM|nr:cardiolipin synthase [Candidatus Baumannia cicadellinicola]AKZ65850.1 Cardiolipin synthetase [Candidatus Baumannia cicadellinicola]
MITFYTIINGLLVLSYWLSIAYITLRILIKRRTVPSAMAWLLVIYILPLVGILIYLLLGELKIGKLRYERNKAVYPYLTKWIDHIKGDQHIFSKENSYVASSLFQLCEKRQGISGLRCHQIQLLNNTNDIIKSLIRDINLAQRNIEMVFYIWQTGGIIDKVAEALMAAARRGVVCRLMLDSAGSVHFFSSQYPALMRDAGVKVVEALNVSLVRLFLRRMDLRQHRKMVLIDNYISYTGSMNMVDPLFFKKKANVGQWIDIMTRMEGPVTIAMGLIYYRDWEVETGERIKPTIKNILPFQYSSSYIQTIQVIASGPGFPEGVIHQALLIAIYAAREQLVITTPYLVPSDDLLHAICTAAQRGVKVHILIPRKNDSMLVGWASRSYFSELLEAGVLIHQFYGGLLHTKSMLVDGQLSLFGTVNLDMRSLWLNFEITLVIDAKNFACDLARVQEDYIANSKLIDVQLWLKRPYWQRIIERLFYFFSPLL